MKNPKSALRMYLQKAVPVSPIRTYLASKQIQLYAQKPRAPIRKSRWQV